MSSIGSVSQPRPTASTSTSPSLEGLQRGSRGPDVMALQQQLNARGAKLEVDGKFGPLTEAALKQFQASAGCGSSGRVDAGTVAALQAPAKPTTTPTTTTSTTTTPTTPRASGEVQQGARARCAADEGRIRAQLAEVPTTKPAGATTTPATTTTPAEGIALTPAQVQTALANIEAGKKQVAEEKAVVGQVKEALQREVGELEQPVAGATRTVADDAVLAGRKAQLEVVTKADAVLDLKAQGLDAAATALQDGVLTPDEAKHLVTVDGALQKSEAALKEQGAAATSLVERGLKAGGRGSPTLGLKKPETPPSTTAPTPPPTPANGTTIPKADLDVATQRIQQAVAGARAEKEALGTAKATLEREVQTLSGLKDRTVADDAVLAGRKAQLEVLGRASEHLDIRLAGLDAATRALGDGVLTADEQRHLATLDSSLTAAQQQLAAQASLAAALVQRGRAAGGRGSDVLL